MKRTLRLLIAVFLSTMVAVPVCAGQASEATKEPDVRKTPSPKSGSKKPTLNTFPTPSGPEEPRNREQPRKSPEGPGVRKNLSPKAGSRKPISDTIPAPTGTEGPEMRKAEQTKAN